MKQHLELTVGQQSKHLQQSGGFSLMELLVSLAILAIVSTLGTTMLIKMTDAWRTVSTQVELYREGDQLLAQFREDVDRLVSSDMSGIPVVGSSSEYTESDPEHPLFDVPREVATVALPVEIPIDGVGNTRRFMVHYEIDNTVVPPVLMRSTQPFPSMSEAASTEETTLNEGSAVLEGAIALRFEYYDGTESPENASAWQDSWDADAHPQAIRLSLVMANPDRLDEQVSRQATYYTAVQ